jgi:hypothetical protein
MGTMNENDNSPVRQNTLANAGVNAGARPETQSQSSPRPPPPPQSQTQSQEQQVEAPIEKEFEFSSDFNIQPVKNPAPPPQTGNQTNTATRFQVSNQPIKTAPLTEKEKFAKKALRTYESDVAEFMSHRGTSVASVAIAESEKKKRNEIAGNEAVKNVEEKSNTSKKLFLLLISLILVAAGAIGAYYLYSQSALAPQPAVAPAQQKTVSLIPSDSQVNISIDGLAPSQILGRIQAEISKNQAPNTVKEIILAKTFNNQSVRVNGPDALTIMDINAPDMLARSLTNNWMLGVHSDAGGNKSVFVVATNNFFQNAFAGMLAWENVMADDLKQYLYTASPMGIANVIPAIIAATSTVTASSSQLTQTASSSQPKIAATSSISEKILQPYFTIRGHFVDGIVKNRDAREFKTEAGDVLFLYSFIDNTKLVWAGREETLAEIVSRLEQRAFVR